MSTPPGGKKDSRRPATLSPAWAEERAAAAAREATEHAGATLASVSCRRHINDLQRRGDAGMHVRVCRSVQSLQSRCARILRVRYLGTNDGEGRFINRRSILKFLWDVDFSDGTHESSESKVRADHVQDRGVSKPPRLAAACARGSKKLRASKYSAAGAAALADAATRQAESSLGPRCASVACECACVERARVWSH